MSTDDTFLPIAVAGTTLPLKPCDGLPAMAHVFERDSILAVNTAIACNRPLLIKGEPGSGKSQLARAVAQRLGRELVAKYVDARTEAHDLLWSQDAVSRLAEAQVVRAAGASVKVLARSKYVVPGPLWWAINWQSAMDHVGQAVIKPSKIPGKERPTKGMVVLIDEIDKADSSVPNGLLECLGQQTFTVPGVDGQIVAKPPLPLVMLTSNDERPLPRAFVRRCVVLHLRLPQVDLASWLATRGRAHFAGKLSDADILAAADQVVRDRDAVDERHKPGLAEYIDLLTALHRGVGSIAAIAPFVLRKHADPGEAPA